MTASSIHDAVALRVAERNGHPLCKLGKVLASLTLADQDALSYALDEVKRESLLPQNKRTFTIVWVERLLNDHGHVIGKTVISDHLAGRCACDSR